MDECNIISVNDEASNGRPKDDRPLHQQRSVIMNSVDCIAQYRAHAVQRAAEPARRAQLAEQRDAARVLREAKSAEAKAKKDARETEKQRRKSLTPAELKAENKAKRAASKLARQPASEPLLPQPNHDDAIDNNSDSDEDDINLFDDDEIANISQGVRFASV